MHSCICNHSWKGMAPYALVVHRTRYLGINQTCHAWPYMLNTRPLTTYMKAFTSKTSSAQASHSCLFGVNADFGQNFMHDRACYLFMLIHLYEGVTNRRYRSWASHASNMLVHKVYAWLCMIIWRTHRQKVPFMGI